MSRFLMIPVRLDALILPDSTLVIEALTDFKELPYFTGAFDANADTAYISENFVTEPLENLSLTLRQGVHLHWSLPDALSRGRHVSEEDRLDFPAVPNRWLVTRISQGTTRSWVIESDYLYPANKAGMDQGLTDGAISYPIHSDPNKPDPPFRFMGRAWPLDEWLKSQHEGNYLPKLTAVGYGEPTFAALYPNCRSVFGFHDPDPIVDNVHYSVFGWFSDPKLDPCAAGLKPADLDDKYRWSLPNNTKDEDAPERLLCWAVESLRSAATADQRPPTDQIEVTIGNTATEALSAYLAHLFNHDEDQARRVLEDQLEALNLSPLLQHRQVDIGPKFEEARHEKGFEAVYGGALWEVRPVPSGNDPAGHRQSQGEITLPPDLAHQLDALNLIQQSHDQAIFALQSWRERLYSDWYRYMLASFPPPGEQGDYPDPDRVRHFIESHDLPHYRKHADQVQQLENQVKNLLGDMIHRLPELQLVTVKDVTSWADLTEQLSTRSEATLTPLKSILAKLGSNDSEKLHQQALDALNHLIEQTGFNQTLHFPGPLPAEAQQILEDAKKAGKWDRYQTLRYNRLLLQDICPALARRARYELHRTPAPRFWQPREPVLLLVGPGLEPTDRHSFGTQIECELLSLENEPPAAWTALYKWLTNKASLDFGEDTGNQSDNADPIPIVNVTKVNGKESVTINVRNFPSNEQCTIFIKFMGDQGMDSVRIDNHESDENGRFSSECPIPIPLQEYQQLGIRIESVSGLNAETWFTITSNLPWNPIFLEWQVELFPVAEPDKHRHPAVEGYVPDYLNHNYRLGEKAVDLASRGHNNEVKGLCLYSGRSLVTAHAAPILRHQIDEYLAQILLVPYFEDQKVPEADRSSHYFVDHQIEIVNWYLGKGQPDPFIEDLSRIIDYLDHQFHGLSQTLSGFNAALLGHKQTMQLPVQSPLAFPTDRPFVEEMSKAIGRQNRVAPQPQNDFTPIRSGVLRIARLRLVNNFGQVWEIDPPQVLATDVMFRPDDSKRITLPPRLVQPVRLDWNWLAAQGDEMEMNSHPATSPICGWLLPNNLNNSIEVYNADGQPLGTLNLKDAWWPAPAAATSIANIKDITNPHLRRVVSWLHSHAQAGQGKGLTDFIAALDSAQENIDPDGFAQREGLALLMGRPLAVVRASVGLEIRGLLADDQGWNIFRQELASGKHDTAGIEDLRVPVRLSERRQLNDGLVGYWLEKDNSTLSPEFYSPQSDPMDSQVIVTYGDDESAQDPRLPHLQLSLAGPPQHLTLLIDPRGAIHATSGLLPTAVLTIPGDQYAASLASIEVTFFSTPVLQSLPLEAASPPARLPLPTEEGYAWSWLERNKDNTWLEVTDIGSVEHQAKFDGSLTVREGWLRLRPQSANQAKKISEETETSVANSNEQ
jgi:hypothetical protein